MNSTSRYYAHSREDDPNPESWQDLADHLRGVAELASSFAAQFASSEWGRCAGLLHDLGKFQPEFQRRLRGERIYVEHSGVGAAAAVSMDGERGIPMAFVVTGHHAGLANLITGGNGLPTPLKDRLRENQKLFRDMMATVSPLNACDSVPQYPEFLLRHSGDLVARRLSTEFWIRFLFSSLVDADRLDTERFSTPAAAGVRGGYASITDLRQRIDSHIDDMIAGLRSETRNSTVNRARLSVLDACRRAACLKPGTFSLTVPTGGGKTLSAMSFALRHAERCQLQRVIVVIPYTSIIEQNANAYRSALGPENVVEHHSNLDPVEEESLHGQEVTRRHALACENWDAPVIVTTTVQFFESLFSNRPSRCRKLHNVARSVIVLDEVQTLPPSLLAVILDGLNELVSHYDCSVVLSTATPPALSARERFDIGLRGTREIVPAPRELAANLRRVRYEWPPSEGPTLDWPSLARDLAQFKEVLAVVHRRADARALAQELQALVPEGDVLHLSALMCPAHRSDVLARAKALLLAGDPCSLVTTQLVEAGVDIDFPVVYRALGGLDSVVQAAGRCNREGMVREGRVVVFRAPTNPPRGTPSRGLEITDSLLRQLGQGLDPVDPEIFDTYFRMLYMSENPDLKGIQALRREFNFATVAREFKLIEDGFSKPIVVPYAGATERIEALRTRGPSRERMRALQPFTVSIYPDMFNTLNKAGALEFVADCVFAVVRGFERQYDGKFGLVVGDEPVPDPTALMI